MRGLFRRGMKPSRNSELVPELLAQVSDLVQRTSREQNAAVAHAVVQTERSITQLLEKIMHTLEEVLDVVTGSRTKIDSLIALVDGLHLQVKDALGATATPSMQMRIDQVFDAAKSNADAIDKAVTANTASASAGAVSDGPSAADIKSGSVGGPATAPDGSQPSTDTPKTDPGAI